MGFWYNGKKITTKKITNPEPLQQKSADWMDQMVQGNMENEDIRHLFGKPLDLHESLDFDYQMTKTLKNAGYLPPWVELQHEIRDRIARLLPKMDQLTEEEIGKEIEEINLKIRKYNQSCPSPHLQKSPIYKESIVQQYDRWV